jgi:hypothetical protein
MPKGYANIACSIGNGISDRVRHTTHEPLPERLTDLLSRLSENEDTNPRANSEAPRGSHSRKGFAAVISWGSVWEIYGCSGLSH